MTFIEIFNYCTYANEIFFFNKSWVILRMEDYFVNKMYFQILEDFLLLERKNYNILRKELLRE